MQYVMSDLHGCYDLYLKMLEKIRFGDSDTLYYLGDAADRGADGIRIIQDFLSRRNVLPLLGNHEDMFREAVRAEKSSGGILDRISAKRSFRNWTEGNGGDVTWRDYCNLTDVQRREIACWLEELPLYYEVHAGGRAFLLVHAGVGNYVPEKDLSMCGLHDFIWGRMDYTKEYYQNRYLVSGHTPTIMINPAARGRIWRGNNHIAVDCGAVFFGTLGCLCLDTLEEFYV